MRTLTPKIKCYTGISERGGIPEQINGNYLATTDAMGPMASALTSMVLQKHVPYTGHCMQSPPPRLFPLSPAPSPPNTAFPRLDDDDNDDSDYYSYYDDYYVLLPLPS